MCNSVSPCLSQQLVVISLSISFFNATYTKGRSRPTWIILIQIIPSITHNHEVKYTTIIYAKTLQDSRSSIRSLLFSVQTQSACQIDSESLTQEQ
mmetsp:Transcript_32863/g.69142  ORF Transcript_32863/g.69142 Transcript_32863/m.69142 type:complete len:95 (+) Transcript_32863:1361-1645(+)